MHYYNRMKPQLYRTITTFTTNNNSIRSTSSLLSSLSSSSIQQHQPQRLRPIAYTYDHDDDIDKIYTKRKEDHIIIMMMNYHKTNRFHHIVTQQQYIRSSFLQTTTTMNTHRNNIMNSRLRYMTTNSHNNNNSNNNNNTKVTTSSTKFDINNITTTDPNIHITLHHINRLGYYINVDNNNTTNNNDTTTTMEDSTQNIKKNNHQDQNDDNEDNDYDENDPSYISIISIHRPKAGNSIGYQMLQQLHNIIIELEESHSRCIIIVSQNLKVFCSGADLKERATMKSLNDVSTFVTNLQQTIHRLSQLPMPTICAIEGMTYGGGFEIALATDIRIASTDAIFGFPETTLAIVPGAGGTQRLSRLIGIARAKELIYTGQQINGTTAYEYGIVQHVVPPGSTFTKAIKLAGKIAEKSPIAIQSAKFAIDVGYDASNMKDALLIEQQAYERVLHTQDRIEGLAAFNEKRKPKYKGI